MGLQKYQHKRDFKKTPEPRGRKAKETSHHIFVVQKHDASRLHYDFRLELDGVLKSWAVPKGPSLDPKIKRLAVEVEDHPIDYATFEGTIPEGEYGAGEVIVWDRGEWEPVKDPHQGLKKGHLEFKLQGEKLNGGWSLIRTRPSGKQQQWLLIKKSDNEAIKESKYDITKNRPDSVKTGSTLTVDSKKKKLPEFVDPQLATLADRPPEGDQWIHEIKFDGYRTLCRIQNKKVTCYTRTGLDWTTKYRSLVPELKKLAVKNALLDGEIVQLDDFGRSDFHLLQLALKNGKTNELVYYVFDLLELNGEDLRSLPQIQRKKKLEQIIKNKFQRVVYSDHWQGDGAQILEQSCKLDLEGVISKDKEQPYSSGRGTSWIKSKCTHGQEFVIGGYTDPKNHRTGLGALLLGAHREGELVYVGKVGTGFNQSELVSLIKQFKKIAAKQSPFNEKIPEKYVHWLKPKLVAEVQFRGWTADGLLRQGAYKGLRSDKKPEQITFEKPVDVKAVEQDTSKTHVTLTNAKKILIPEAKITKGDLWNYYETVHQQILPHLIDRPLSLVHCQNEIKKECFFQKKLIHPSVDIKEREIKDAKGKLGHIIFIKDIAGLLSLVQLGVIEIHTWGCHQSTYMNPDQVVFDLDPGEGVKWKQICDAATRIRDILKVLQLPSFVKVSGGKGLHVHVPVAPVYSWEQIKEFSRAIATELVHENPKLYLATMAKAKRPKKIFIDFFRNGYGATSIAPYSMRARKEASIALPVEWDAIYDLRPNQFTLKKAVEFLNAQKRDPWQDYSDLQPRIELLDKSA